MLSFVPVRRQCTDICCCLGVCCTVTFPLSGTGRTKYFAMGVICLCSSQLKGSKWNKLCSNKVLLILKFHCNTEVCST